MVELLTSLFLVAGGVFALIGSIGLARLPDLFMRLHGPTKATTLGVGGILVASMLHFSSLEAGFSLHELLVALFLLITAPVSAHLVARSMLHLRGGSGAVLNAAAKGPQNSQTPDREVGR
jgi:multicomponent K+:H+ antiporter subunit G